MNFQSKGRCLFILLVLILLLAPSLISNVKAQDGTGSSGLVVKPDSGPAGTKVEVAFKVDSAFSYMYRNEIFQLVWDIGGWNKDNPADWYTVKQSNWNVIGNAKFDFSGQLTGTAIIPATSNNQIGDHVIYAISEKFKTPDSAPLNFWWGWFEINTATIVATPTPSPRALSTPHPTINFQTPTPTPSPPDMITLTIEKTNGVDIAVQDTLISYPYEVQWPYGTNVKLQAEITDENHYEFHEWDWSTSTGSSSSLHSTIIITLTDNTIASADVHEKNSIPGFPLESIAIGLILALGLVYIAKKKSADKLLSTK
jgi:hypothetical protein